jgi:hypothetical protein
MSMSEFEGQRDKTETDVFHRVSREEFPTDFTDEDITFAQELDELFAVEQEEMPPLFVQTLSDAEKPLYAVVEPDLEVKTKAKVFRELHLKRTLFHSSRPSLQMLLSEMGGYCRPLRPLLIACIFFMALTMAISGPAFASGLHYLWVGSHTGVVEVNSYPHVTNTSNVKANGVQQPQVTKLTFGQAQQLLHFPLYIPSHLPPDYVDSSFYMYAGDQTWADGPIMVLNYSHPVPGISLNPISIYEFKPKGDARVSQVVEDGSVQQIQINAKNGSNAIYVNGQWQQGNGAVPSWVYNDRSELIWENPQTGVVFWVVGDKRDGISEDRLSSLVKSLYKFNNTQFHGHVASITQMDESNPSAFADDVIYLDDPNSSSGPSFHLMGTTQTPPFSPGHTSLHANSYIPR